MLVLKIRYLVLNVYFKNLIILKILLHTYSCKTVTSKELNISVDQLKNVSFFTNFLKPSPSILTTKIVKILSPMKKILEANETKNNSPIQILINDEKNNLTKFEIQNLTTSTMKTTIEALHDIQVKKYNKNSIFY